MGVRPIAAGPHLILNYQPGQPHGSPTGPGQSVGLTIGGQLEPSAFTHGGRSHPGSLLPFSQNNDAALAAVAALRRLADLIEDAAAPEASGNLFRREGQYWKVCFEGSVARLADAKGLRLLARLLADPGREFHAVDLEAASSQTQRPASTGARAAAGWGELQVLPDLGDAGELLDATAKAAYKARLDELQAELDQAERFSDSGRAATASAERDFLVGELARAVGLGGRDRRAASHAERARLNVTRAIRAAMANLTRANPPLGRHLAATIRTGRYCSYTPDPRAPITWNSAPARVLRRASGQRCAPVERHPGDG
jgi:hypothetical protein